jgi:hypothetical protein
LPEIKTVSDIGHRPTPFVHACSIMETFTGV